MKQLSRDGRRFVFDILFLFIVFHYRHAIYICFDCYVLIICILQINVCMSIMHKAVLYF